VKFIKPYSTFVNESESGYYPAGTEHDPNAPWNQKDDDIYREISWIDERGAKERIKFDLVATDMSEYAVLRHLETGDLYLAYLAGDEITPYMPQIRELVGKDEDGFADYDYMEMDMDNEAIIAMASDELENAGEGVKDYEDGKALVKIDAELKDYLLADWKRWGETSPQWADLALAIEEVDK